MSEIKVMIVEDDESIHFYLSSIFEERYPNLSLIQVYDGNEALAMLDQIIDPIHFIFLDLNMPVLDGHEFLSKYNELYGNSLDTKVIILTSSDSQKDINSTKQYSFITDYLVKPIFEDSFDRFLKES